MRRGEVVDGTLVELWTAGVPVQALEETHVVAAEGRAVRDRSRDRQIGIDQKSMGNGGMLEVEHRDVLTRVRNLENGVGAAVLDQERPISLTAEIARGSMQAEYLRRDLRDLLRGEARRLCFED